MAFKGHISVKMTRTWTETVREERPLLTGEPRPFPTARKVIVVSEKGRPDQVTFSSEPVAP